MGKEDKGTVTAVRLLFMGDSLIEYFDWQGRFPGHEVHNLGISGETVEGLHARLGRIFERTAHPDVLFIMSGINNLAMDDRDFHATYRKIVAVLKRRYPAARIVIHSLLPVLSPFISNDDIRAANKELKTIAEEENVVFEDIHSRFLDGKGNPRASYLLEDGVHLSDEGYRAWSAVVERHLAGSA